MKIPKIIYNNKFLKAISILINVGGITIYPFIILREECIDDTIKNKITKNHELIHIKQQQELLVVVFYYLYILEFIVRYILYYDVDRAYRSISFEKEAYDNESNFKYVEKRKFLSWVKYL